MRQFMMMALVLLVSTECWAQTARLVAYNRTGDGVILQYSSDIAVLKSQRVVTGDPPAIIFVGVRPSGITNFIAVAEILLPGERLPGVKFELQNGQQRYVVVRKVYPGGYTLDVLDDAYFKGILGDEIFDSWQKVLNKAGEQQAKSGS